MSARKLLTWTLLLACSAALAVGIARWWAARAEDRLQKHFQTATLAEMQRVTAQRDWDPTALYWLGARQVSAGQYREALASFVRAAALKPTSAPIRAALGHALALNGRADDAKSQLDQAIALDPNLPFAHFALGNLYASRHRWEPAAEELKKASELKPSDLEAQYQLALCYEHLYLEDRKLEILERLVKQSPNDIRFLKSLGYVYLFFGKFAEGEELYRRILRMAPNDDETHYLLGRALAEQASTPEQFANAEQELQTVVKKSPEQPGVHVALGILYFRRNDPAKAVIELQRAIRAGTTEYKTWLYLGQSLMRVGRTEEGKRTLAEFQRATAASRAITQLENRIRSMPADTPARIAEDSQVRLRLARVYLDDHQVENAMNHIEVVLSRDARNAEALKLAARCQAMASAPHEPEGLPAKPE